MFTADFHLLWNSPLINRGNPPNVLDAFGVVYRDGEFPGEIDYSRTDIGHFGGPGADEFIWGDDWVPYCVIDAQHNVLNNDQFVDNREFLEWDYYRVFSHIKTPDGQILDIGDPNLQAAQGYFEFLDYVNWTVDGIIRIHGNEADPLERNVVFAGLDGTQWGQFLINQPDGDCMVNGCDIMNALIPLKISGAPGAGDPVPVNVINSKITADDFFPGIQVSNLIRLVCQNSEIDGGSDAVFFTYNEQLENPNLRSVLDNVTIQNAKYTGAYCYRSTARIVASHIFHNDNYGIQAAFEGNPFIQGEENNRANSIVNNGIRGTHTDTYGAEIMLGGGSMEIGNEAQRIFWNNLYEVRSDEGQPYTREGRIISNSGSVQQVVVTNNYFGQSLWTEQEHGINFPEGEREFVQAEDFFDPQEQLVLQAVQQNILQEDKWDETGDDWREPQNGYEEAMVAVGQDDLRAAVRFLNDFIADSSDSRLAPVAIRMLFRVEFAMGEDLDRLRREYTELARQFRGNSRFTWAARRSAARALYHQERYEEFAGEIRSFRNEAPNEIEALYVDIDVLLAEDMIDADNVDDVRSRYQRLGEIRRRIDELESGEAEQRSSVRTPTEFELVSIHPNPFNAQTLISIVLPEDGRVEFEVFDVLGRRVAYDVREMPSGRHTVVWSAQDVTAGNYLLKVTASGVERTQKLVLIK